MLDNLVFSIGIVLPIFLVMAIGYYAKSRKMLDKDFVTKANKLIFNVVLPLKLFGDVANTTFDGAFDIPFIAFAMLGTLLTALAGAGVSVLAVKEKFRRGAFAQGVYRGNFLYVGFSILENMTGTIGTAAPLLVAFVTPLYNAIAVVMLTMMGPEEDSKIDVRSILMSIVKNPLIIAIVLGLISSLSGMAYPLALTRTFKYCSCLATPLALIAIGASFSFGKLTQNFGVSALASALKLIVFPAIIMFSASALGFSTEQLMALFVLFAVPTAATSYIMVSVMGGDEDTATNIIMTTTVLSVFTITAFIFVFKSFALI